MEYSERIRQLKLPTLVFRRIHGDIIELYKIKNIYNSNVASQRIQLHTNKNTRGHSIKLRRDHVNRDIRRSFLIQRAAATTRIRYWENHPLRSKYTADHEFKAKNITYNIEHNNNEPEPE